MMKKPNRGVYDERYSVKIRTSTYLNWGMQAGENSFSSVGVQDDGHEPPPI